VTVGFPEVPIGELARSVERPVRPIEGHSYRQLGVRLWGKGAYERDAIDGGETSYASLSRVAAGDIVVNKIWARNGSVAVVPTHLDGCYVSGEFPTFQCVPDRLDPRWFHWITRARWFWDRCDIEARGTSGKNRIRPERFLTIPVPAPPLSEQRRIVARIEELAAEIGAATVLRNESGGLGQVLGRRARDVAFESLKRIGRVSVASVSEFVTKGTTPKTYGHPFAATGVPFLRAEEVGDGRLNWRATPFFLSQETNLFMNRSRTRAGDVLVTIAGTIGRAAVVPSDAPQLNMNQAVCVIRPLAMADSDYLCHFIRSSAGQEQLRLATVTSALSNISLGTVRRVALPLPTLSEQRRIVAYLDDIQAKLDALKTLQEKTGAELDALMPSILDKAFRGEL